MAQIKILGDSLTLTSAIKMEDLTKLQKFAPDALQVKDADGNVTFAVAPKPGANPNFSRHGVVLTSVNAEGLASATFPLPVGIPADKRVTAVQDTFGLAIIELNKIETQIAARTQELEVALNTVAEAVTIVD